MRRYRMIEREDILDEWDEGKLEYQRDSVLLVVEDIDNSMLITHTKMDSEDIVQLVVFMIDKLSRFSGIAYNEILEDLKEKEEGEK